jgi:long-chain acyl-CoA synthetase
MSIGPRPAAGGAWRFRNKELHERLIERTTIPDVLALLAARPPGTPALTWYEDGVKALHLDYKNLLEQISRVAYRLAAAYGVRRFDRVMIASANCPEAFIAHLAIMSLGAVTVPVSVAESSRVLKLIVGQLEPCLFLIGRRVQSDMIALPSMPRAVSLSDLMSANAAPSADARFSAASVHPDDPAVILFTSGTTSAPKGVCLSHYNLLVNAEALWRAHDLNVHRVHLCVLPLFHANAFGFSLVACVYAASHVVLCDGLPGFNVWSILRDERVNIFSTVPEIIRILSQRPVPRQSLPDLKYVTSGAAPLSKGVARAFQERTGIPIHQGYGLSECVNFAAATRWDVTSANFERLMFDYAVPSIGPSVFGCEVGIRRPDGTAAAAEELGEIVVSGHSIMLGYWQAPEATREALEGGYLHTGDVGFFVPIDGVPHFFITGRRKEIIIRYGETISPVAVEAELEDLRAVGNFAATGFANGPAGEEIGVYIAVPRTPANEAKVIEILRRSSVLYRPRVALFGDSPVPATAVGKIKRAVLAKRFHEYANRTFGNDPVLATDKGEGVQAASAGELQAARQSGRDDRRQGTNL